MNERGKQTPADQVPNGAVLRRRGRRRATGADTPAGPQTDRSVKRAKREIEGREDRYPEKAPGTHTDG
jgi:hypothetical protein